MRWLLALFLSVAVVGLDVRHVDAQDDWGITRPGARRGRGRAGRGRTGRGRAGRAGRTGRGRSGRTGRGRTGRGRTGRGATSEGTPAGQTSEAEASSEAGGGRTAALIARYLRILESDPRETFAFRRLLDLYRERDGNVDGFVQELSARVAADDEAYAPRMLLGHLYRAQNRLDEARAIYGRAAELREREAAPRIALAQVERAASDAAAARAHYEAALERTRERLAREELLREVAQLAMEQRDYEAARGFYEELGRGGQGSLYLRTEFARALGAAGEHTRAVEEFQRVLRSLRGDNRVLPPILLELSRAQLEAGDTDPSIATLDRALRLAGRTAGIRAEIYDQLLLAHRRADRLDALATRLRGEAGRGFESNELLGRIEDELGNDDEALAAYRRALGARSRDIDTRVRVIQLLSRSGRLDEVIEEYRALIRSAPREPRFVIELAQLLVQTDHREDALRLLRDTGRRHARDPALHQQLAELYSRWGETALASQEVELLARIDPRDPAHLIALGAQQFDGGDRDAAMRTWRRVLEVEPGAQGHATLAGIFADHDLLAESIAEYEEASRLEPEELRHVRGLASTLERHDRTAEAELRWRRVLELAGDDRVARREARERIVGIWRRTRQLTTQIRTLEQRFAADPPDVESGRFLAEAHRRRGPEHTQSAERVLARIVEIDPGDVETLLALERVRRQRGDLAGAIDALRLLREADPRRASHYLSRMAEHALALYRDEEAIEYAAEAVQRNPEDATAHRRLGDLYRSRQDGERAIASYRRALELNERLYPVYFELAELHLARSQTERADQLYRQLLRVTPDDDLVARAARASIQLNLGAGTLDELERVLLPLSLAHPQRPIFRRVAVELYDAYAGPLVLRARRGGAGADEARVELRRIGTRGIKPLLEALADQDPGQRRVALDILGDLGNPNAAAPLLALAESTSIDLGQRLRALEAAGALESPALVERFTALAEGTDARLRGLAIWALSRIGGRDATRALTRVASSGDSATRANAVIALGALQATPTTPALGTVADPDVLMATLWSLGRTGEAQHTGPLGDVLRQRGGAPALIAAHALGEIGGPDADATLLRALFEPDPQLRRAAAEALRRSAARGDDAPETLTLPAPEPFERPRDYVQRLSSSEASPGEAMSPVDLSPWSGALAESARLALSGPPEQALAALSVLGTRDDGVGLGPLTEGLESWPAAERTAALSVLGALAEPLLPALIAASEHRDTTVRVQAVRLLARLSDAGADAAVASALGGALPEVTRAALEALARADRAPSAETVARLLPILATDRDWSMRTRAAAALRRAQSAEARAGLRESLEHDSYAFVREAAALALALAPTAEDRATLERAAQSDGEPRVRRAAECALGGADSDACIR